MNIVFAGTPAFSVPTLRALVHAGYEISAVYTQPDRRAGRGRKHAISPVKEYALEQGLTVRQPRSLNGEAGNIADLGCDVMVVVAYGMLLPQDVLDVPRLGCLNVHASILPRWRGAAPIQRAIEAGDQETGVSIMHMEAGLDTGPVYKTDTIPIAENDTAQTIHDQLAEVGASALVETIGELNTGQLVATAQDDSLATYAHKLEKSEAEIDWSRPASELHRRIRAFNPWPVCQSNHRGDRIRVWAADLLDNDTRSTQAGSILSIKPGHIVVCCGSGALGLTRLQRDGGKPLATDEFLRGYPMVAGDSLGRPDPTENLGEMHLADR